MENLTPTLNDVQLKQNIDFMKSKKIPDTQIQEYVNKYQKSDTGYSLKTADSNIVQPPKNYQPNNDQERDYLSEAGKIYDNTWAKPSTKILETAGKFLTDIGETVASPLTNLAIGIYARSKGVRDQARQDKEFANITQNITDKINNPDTSIEEKKRLAHVLNTTFPPNAIINAISGDLTPKKALYDTANSIFETALLGLGGGTGLEAKGVLNTVKEVGKDALKFGTLQTGQSISQGMGENKPLTEIIDNGLKQGLTTAGLVSAIEAGVPALRIGGGVLSNVFGWATKKIAGKGGDAQQLEKELQTLVSGIKETAPKSEDVGNSVLDTLSLQQKVAKDNAVQNLKNVSDSMEKDYVHPNIVPEEIGARAQSEIENWRQGEKDIAHNIFEAKDLSTNKAQPNSFVTALQDVQSKVKNVAFLDSLKNQIGKATNLVTEIDPKAQQIIDSMSGYPQKNIDAVLKKEGLSASPVAKSLTVQEMIDTKQAIDEIVFKGSGDIKPKDTRLVALSMGLKEDINRALKGISPEKAKAYDEALSRYGSFKDAWSQLRSSSMSDNPMETFFNMSAKERDTLFNLPSLKDNIAEIQQGLVNHAIQQSKELGTLNPSKLEAYLLKAEKNNILPAEDILRLKEYADLQTLTQGSARNATPAQSERLQKLLGEDRFKQFQQGQKELTDTELALKQSGTGQNIDEMKTQADLVVNNIVKLKSANGFDNIWNKLDDAQKKDISNRTIANAFSESFTNEGGVDLGKLKSYLESIGVGGGNKTEIMSKLFDEPTRKSLEELFQELNSIQNFQKAPNKKVTQILHTILALGYTKTGQAPTAIYHFGNAFRLQGQKAPDLKAKELVNKLMGNEEYTPDTLSKMDFQKVEESALNELIKIAEKTAVIGNSEVDSSKEEYLKNAEELVGHPLSEEERQAVIQQYEAMQNE